MKRFLATCLVVMLLLGLVGCNKEDGLWKTTSEGLKVPIGINTQLSTNLLCTSLQSETNGYRFSGDGWSVYAMHEATAFEEMEKADYRSLAEELSPDNLYNAKVYGLEETNFVIYDVETQKGNMLCYTAAAGEGIIGYTLYYTDTAKRDDYIEVMAFPQKEYPLLWEYTGDTTGVIQDKALPEGWGYNGTLPWPIKTMQNDTHYWANEDETGYYVFAVGDEIKFGSDATDQLDALKETFINNGIDGYIKYFSDVANQGLLYYAYGTYFVSIATYDENGNIQMTCSDLTELESAIPYFQIYHMDVAYKLLVESEPYWSSEQ